jgi:hypothetical protein
VVATRSNTNNATSGGYNDGRESANTVGSDGGKLVVVWDGARGFVAGVPGVFSGVHTRQEEVGMSSSITLLLGSGIHTMVLGCE